MKREAEAGAMTGSGGPTSPHKRYRQGDDELRLLIPSKVAGSIIGKGGQNITKLRSQYKASIIVPDCPGPERVLTISSDLPTVLQVLNEVVPNLEENGSRHGSDEIDVRMLVHQSQAGCIIGKAGLKIKELREKTGARIKIYSNTCPRSTDRLISICGKPTTCIECIRELIATIKTSPLKGVNNPYDPHNFDDFYADDYGGYGNADGGQGKVGGFGGPGRGGGGGGGGGGSGNRGGPPPYGGGNYNGDGWGMQGGAPNGLGGGGNTGMGGPMGGNNQGNQGNMSGNKTSTQVTIPKDLAGAIIGKGGARIRKIRSDSGAGITIDEPLPGSNDRIITITGIPSQIQMAQYLLQQRYMDGFTTNDSDKFFSSLVKLVRPDKISIDNTIARQFLDRLDITVETLMEQLMQPCSALLLRCVWIGKIYDCSKIFKTIKSKEGFCCAFNYHYNLNGHISNDFNTNDFNNTSDDLPGVHTILNAPGSGQDVGLAVALNIEPDMYKATSRPYVGASIIIHNAIDFPDIDAHMVAVPIGHVLEISVTGTSIRGMESLKTISQEKRMCYFHNEVPGKIRYSYQSCVSECITKYIHRMCGCLPFYYPEAHSKLNYGEMKYCNKKCLPQCSDIFYTINPENIKMQDVGYDSDLMHDFDKNKVALVYVFFGDASYIEYRKESIISWDSLIGYRKCLAYVKRHVDWFNVYCDNTNLHGFRYINMDESSIIENILWFLICILSIVFCIILMLRLWINYSNNPIITTIYTSNPIWNVSFPAVTICNNNKVYRPHADLIAKNLYMDGFTMNDSDKFFSSLIKLIRPNKIFIDNTTARQVLNRLDMTVEALMEQKAPGSGRDVGLAVALNIEPDMYKATSRPFVGASVIIHDPIDFPDIGAHITTVPIGHVMAISITGTSIRGMESLRTIPLEKRLCYFDDEVKLCMPGEIRYSHQSCISDCIAKHIHHMCDCLPFYYPEAQSIPHHANTETCKKCLPQCTDMLYTINPEYVKMENVGFDSDLIHGFNINNMSFVYVFFGDVSYVEYRKESTISWDSLLASFGGIFGLCLGGSVLSVIELVYLLARQLFRRQKKMLKCQKQSRMKLPPASKMFLSIPIKEKVQRKL
ncbi:PREDICTED: uncharacterized protein LOC108689282 [Atta colombica]|uniref:uncharacterized protein LOC108689282 n=1 Tax=Atta colombica TaxID=520822 RepID=UPI00084CDBE4|nr:PREDICTED: uncharacterized protein LOC108689282 [Atta colombica]